MGRKEAQPFHIDYCFVPEAWVDRLTGVEVGSFADWPPERSPTAHRGHRRRVAVRLMFKALVPGNEHIFFTPLLLATSVSPDTGLNRALWSRGYDDHEDHRQVWSPEVLSMLTIC